MVDIRGFQNSDVPELVRIWTEHWSSLGLPVHVSNTIFEQAILARSFFNPANLLVAENDGSVLAWCHFAPRVGSDASSSTPCDALVNALVFSDAGYEHCDQLLGSVEHQLATSHDRLFVGLIQDEDQGYVGLSPIGAGVGIIEHDARTSALLHARGYQPQSHAQKLVVFTRDYRAPSLARRHAITAKDAYRIAPNQNRRSSPSLGAFALRCRTTLTGRSDEFRDTRVGESFCRRRRGRRDELLRSHPFDRSGQRPHRNELSDQLLDPPTFWSWHPVN